MKLKSILVIGSGSLIGSRFVEMLIEKDVEVYGAGGNFDSNTKLKSFQRLDITDYENVFNVINNSPCNLVINFAGATLVDEIEKTRPKDISNEKELRDNLAYKVNVLGTRSLANVCIKTRKFPIFISTDFVFDGKNGPYSEEDAVADNPDDVSFYAWTKILAEQEVLSSGVDFLMIRPSYPYKQSLPSSYGKQGLPFVQTKGRKEFKQKLDFARSLLVLYDDFKLGKTERIYPIFVDQAFTPTFIDDLAPALKVLLEKEQSGTFHLASPEITTPYKFFCELLRVARGVKNPETVITKGSIQEFQASHPNVAKRSIMGGEKVDKIIALGFIPTTWKDGIKKAYTSQG